MGSHTGLTKPVHMQFIMMATADLRLIGFLERKVINTVPLAYYTATKQLAVQTKYHHGLVMIQRQSNAVRCPLNAHCQ